MLVLLSPLRTPSEVGICQSTEASGVIYATYYCHVGRVLVKNHTDGQWECSACTSKLGYQPRVGGTDRILSTWDMVDEPMELVRFRIWVSRWTYLNSKQFKVDIKF